MPGKRECSYISEPSHIIDFSNDRKIGQGVSMDSCNHGIEMRARLDGKYCNDKQDPGVTFWDDVSPVFCSDSS